MLLLGVLAAKGSPVGSAGGGAAGGGPRRGVFKKRTEPLACVHADGEDPVETGSHREP